MNDVLGNALQKLASTKTSEATEAVTPAHLTEPGPEDLSPSSDKDTHLTLISSGHGILPTECLVSEVVLTREPDASEGEAEIEYSGLAGFQDAPHKRSLKTIFLQNPLPILQANRRRVAAVVVLLCMAAIWSEEQTSNTQQTFVEPTAELTSVESLLEDFATIDSRKMQDPAEPVNLSDPAFELTIPNSTAQTTLGSTQDPGSTGVRFTGRIQPLK